MTNKEALLFVNGLMDSAYGWHINNRLLGMSIEEFEHKCEGLIRMLKAQEPRLMTAEDFNDNPDVDAGGFLPCWVECNETEMLKAVELGIIKPGEAVDGWTETNVESMPGHKGYNPNVRYWTGRPSQLQGEMTPWEG